MEDNLFEVVLINKKNQEMSAKEAEPCDGDTCFIDFCSPDSCPDSCWIDFTG